MQDEVGVELHEPLPTKYSPGRDAPQFLLVFYSFYTYLIQFTSTRDP